MTPAIAHNYLGLLDRLANVRPNGKDKWTARCPAHKDKTNSLAIKDDGGKCLVHCFAGCTFNEICSAAGIEPWQLFADGKRPNSVLKTVKVSQRQMDDLLELEHLVCLLAISDRLARRPISKADQEREALAKTRILKAWGRT